MLCDTNTFTMSLWVSISVVNLIFVTVKQIYILYIFFHDKFKYAIRLTMLHMVLIF
jgi:hypothetical protein